MSINFNAWNSIWDGHNADDLRKLNAVFDSESIYSFRVSSVRAEYDGIYSQIERTNGVMTPTLLFGDDAGVQGSLSDICDNMTSLGDAVAGVVATTSFDLKSLKDSHFMSEKLYNQLGHAYGDFFAHETHYGNINGSSGEPDGNRNNHVYLRAYGLMYGQDSGNVTARAYLKAWDRDLSGRASASAFDVATTEFVGKSGQEMDFGFIARPGHNGAHLLIDTVNFVSGLVELAAVQEKIGAYLHDRSNPDHALHHDDLVQLSRLHGWEDLCALDVVKFDNYFGSSEKIVNGQVTLDANLAEVFNYGVIETAQKIIAIDEQVMAYNLALGDRFQSIFSMLAMTSGTFSNEERIPVASYNAISGDLGLFQSGEITAASILHALEAGNWQGHYVGYGLNDLAQIKIAHFM